MTIRSTLRRWAVVFAAAASISSAALAQPVAVGTVTTPARVDTALRGSVLASANVSGHAACQAECKRVAGCTGYNFAAAAKGLVPAPLNSPDGRIGGVPPGKAANCTLMSGTLGDAAARGVVSCRMPCVAGPAPVTRVPVTQLPPRPLQIAPLPALAPPPPPAPKDPKVPRPPAPPVPAPAPTPAPPLPAPPNPRVVTRTGVSGYEVVPGPMVDVAPLSHTATSAQCPAGKVALGAGYRVTPGGDAQFGLEVRGAMPDGRLATVLVRNANVVDRARAQAFAVCVNAIAGLRAVDGGINAQGSGGPSAVQLACAAHERPVGGGLMGGNDILMGTNAPWPSAAGGVWQAAVTRSSPLPGSANAAVRLLCAPETAVDGWELIESAEVSLGARSRAEPVLSCPGGKALLAAGVSQRSNNLLDMVVAALAPQANTLAWAAQIANRNTIGGSGAVRASLSAVCARRQ